jgi:hydroxypyruvate isomerase
MLRFAANLSMLFTEAPFLDRFALAARAGFAAVECQSPYEAPAREIRARLDDLGLAMVLHNLPAGDWAAGERGLACLPQRTGEFRAGVSHAIAYAHELGVTQVNCLAGIAPAAADVAALRRTLVENLRFTARAFAAEGLRLLVEPINPFDMPGFFVNRTPQAVCHCFINNSGSEALLLVGGEAAKPGNRIVYPRNPSRRADMDAADWWHDAPARELGEHDGLPDRLRSSRHSGDTA